MSTLTNAVMRTRRIVPTVGRITPTVFVLRVLIFGAFFGATAVALPMSGRAIALMLWSIAVALFPRTRIVVISLFAIALIWLAFGGSPSSWRILTFAALLYLAHASAALAAVLPHDCVVSPAVLIRWAIRTLGVIAASLLLGEVALAVLGRLPTASSAIGPAIGAFIAAAIAGLLALQARQRH